MMIKLHNNPRSFILRRHYNSTVYKHPQTLLIKASILEVIQTYLYKLDQPFFTPTQHPLLFSGTGHHTEAFLFDNFTHLPRGHIADLCATRIIK